MRFRRSFASHSDNFATTRSEWKNMKTIAIFIGKFCSSFPLWTTAALFPDTDILLMSESTSFSPLMLGLKVSSPLSNRSTIIVCHWNAEHWQSSVNIEYILGHVFWGDCVWLKIFIKGSHQWANMTSPLRESIVNLRNALLCMSILMALKSVLFFKLLRLSIFCKYSIKRTWSCDWGSSASLKLEWLTKEKKNIFPTLHSSSRSHSPLNREIIEKIWNFTMIKEKSFNLSAEEFSRFHIIWLAFSSRPQEIDCN